MQFSHPRHDPYKNWHTWFAWYPVRIKPGNGTTGPIVWLETIERRRDIEDSWGQTFAFWWYRLSTPESP